MSFPGSSLGPASWLPPIEETPSLAPQALLLCRLSCGSLRGSGGRAAVLTDVGDAGTQADKGAVLPPGHQAESAPARSSGPDALSASASGLLLNSHRPATSFPLCLKPFLTV